MLDNQDVTFIGCEVRCDGLTFVWLIAYHGSWLTLFGAFLVVFHRCFHNWPSTITVINLLTESCCVYSPAADASLQTSVPLWYLFKAEYCYLFVDYFHFIWKVEKERELPSASSFPSCLQQSGLGQDKAGSWNTIWVISHHLLPCRVCITRKLESEVELRLKPNPFSIPSKVLVTAPKPTQEYCSRKINIYACIYAKLEQAVKMN